MTLYKDRFFLHTLLEEHISEDIGNSFFKSWESFKKHLSADFLPLITNSDKYITQIREFKESLLNLNIEKDKYTFTDIRNNTEIKKVFSNVKKINNEYFIIEERKRKQTSKKYINFNFNSDIKIDESIEIELNKKLDLIVNNIVEDSKYKNIFIPIAFNNSIQAHLIGLVVTKHYISIHNGGLGLNYHIMHSTKNKFPQCDVFLNRPEEEILKNFIKKILILNRPFLNISIYTIYNIIFDMIINTEIYNFCKTPINQTLCDNICQIIAKNSFEFISDKIKLYNLYIYIDDNISYYDDSWYYESLSPILKHENFFEMDVYNIKFDFNNIKIETKNFLKNIFNDSYILKFNGKNLDQLLNIDELFINKSKEIKEIFTNNYYNYIQGAELEDIKTYILGTMIAIYYDSIKGIYKFNGKFNSGNFLSKILNDNDLFINNYNNIACTSFLFFSDNHFNYFTQPLSKLPDYKHDILNTIYSMHEELDEPSLAKLEKLNPSSTMMNEPIERLFSLLYQDQIPMKKLISIYPDIGFIREQYSGSCSYNSILLAIARYNEFNKHDGFNKLNYIPLIKKDLCEKILIEKLELLKTKTTELTYYDNIIIDTLYEKLLFENEETKDSDKIIDLCQKIMEYKYIWKYPSLKEKLSPNTIKNAKTQLNEEIDEIDENLINTINKITDIETLANNLTELYDFKKNYNQETIYFYYNKIINKIINILRDTTTKDIDNIINLYKSLISFCDLKNDSFYFTRAETDKEFIFLLLILHLFCADILLFNSYLGCNIDSYLAINNRKNKESKFIFTRNIFINGYINNENLNYIIDLFDKYQLLFPINNKNYYKEFFKDIFKHIDELKFEGQEITNKTPYYEAMDEMLNVKIFFNIILLSKILLRKNNDMKWQEDYIKEVIIITYPNIKKDTDQLLFNILYNIYKQIISSESLDSKSSMTIDNILEIFNSHFKPLELETEPYVNNMDDDMDNDIKTIINFTLDDIEKQRYRLIIIFSLSDIDTLDKDFYDKIMNKMQLDFVISYNMNGPQTIEINIIPNSFIFEINLKDFIFSDFYRWNINKVKITSNFAIKNITIINDANFFKIYDSLITDQSINQPTESLIKLKRYKFRKYVSIKSELFTTIKHSLLDIDYIEQLIIHNDYVSARKYLKNFSKNNMIGHFLCSNLDIAKIQSRKLYEKERETYIINSRNFFKNFNPLYNIFNLTKYFDYYRKRYNEIDNSDIIIKLRKYKLMSDFLILWTKLGKLLFPLDSIDKKISSEEQSLLSHNVLTICNYSNHNFILNDSHKLDAYIMKDYKSIMNNEEMLEIIEHYSSKKDYKSLHFFNNLIEIAKCSQSIVYVNKAFKDGLESAYLIAGIEELSSSNTWCNKLEQYKLNFDEYKYKRTILKFTNNGFSTIFPDLDITDSESIISFEYFCYRLLITWSYKLLSIYLPQLISCYYTKITNYKLINQITLVNFMLENNYFNSPYKYYFLNKLHYLINGNYSEDLIYELSKREPYYPKKYRKFFQDKLEEYSIPSEYLKILDMWNIKANHLINESQTSITKANLLEILNHINTNLKDKEEIYTRYYININDVYEFTDMIDYLNNETIYLKMFINLQLDMYDNLYSVATSDINDIEILGNIKYYLNGMFDHKITSSTSTDIDKIFGITKTCKLFEMITGKLIDKTQFNMIFELCKSNNDSIYNINELLMGRGKTYIIIPTTLLIFYNNRKYKNIMTCMPEHLITQSCKIINKLIPFMSRGYMCYFNIDRIQTKNIKLISEIFNTNNEKIIITSDSSIKSYLLTTIETNKDRPDVHMRAGGYISLDMDPTKINDILDPYKKELNLVRNDTSKFIDNTLLIIDEIDMICDPLTSDLNYPINTDNQLSFQNILIKIILTITRTLFIKYNTFITKLDRSDTIQNKLLIKKILLDKDSIPYKDLKEIMTKFYDKTIKKIKKKGQIDQFTQLDQYEENIIKNINDKTVIKQKGGTKQIPDELLIYYMREVYTIYHQILIMMLDKDFGWDYETSKNPYIAIPYSAQDTPLSGSQFSNVIITMILTSIIYYTKNFRNIDANEYIKLVMYYHKQLGRERVIDEFEIDDSLFNACTLNLNIEVTEILNKLRKTNYIKYTEIISKYLEYFILNYNIKIDPLILNTSFYDIIDPQFIKAKFGLSGTVNIHLPKFDYNGKNNTLSNIITDDITKLKIEKALVGDNLLKYKPKILVLSGDILDILEKYDVFIDCGSFLRFYNNKEIADSLSKKYPLHLIVYFDNKDTLAFMLNQQEINYDVSKLKKEKNIKVYYDQKHIVGSDLNLPSTAKALLSVQKYNTYTQVVQALFRMREINYYQSFDYIINQSLKEYIDQTNSNKSLSLIKKLVLHIKKNESTKYKNSIYKFLQQNVLTLIRTLHNYSYQSYMIDIFSPNMVDSKIMNDYTYDYNKDIFIKQINSFIAYWNNKLVKDDVTKSLISQIIKIKNEIISINQDVIIPMVQKQSNTQKQIVYEVQLEENTSEDNDTKFIYNFNTHTYKELVMNLDCFMYDDDIKKYVKTEDCENTVNKYLFQEYNEILDWQTFSYVKQGKDIDLLKIFEEIGVQFSPSVLSYIVNIYQNGIRKQINNIYINIYYSINEKTKKYNIFTSTDLIVLRTINIENSQIFKIEKFTDDSIINLIKLLFLEFPIGKEIILVKETIIEASIFKSYNIKKILCDHYKNNSYYNITSLSSEFSNLIDYEDK
jgi:hypothetical protein